MMNTLNNYFHNTLFASRIIHYIIHSPELLKYQFPFENKCYILNCIGSYVSLRYK